MLSNNSEKPLMELAENRSTTGNENEATSLEETIFEVGPYEQQFEPYSLNDFVRLVEKLTRQPGELRAEYKTLPTHAYSRVAARKPQNKNKNRYIDIVPFDHCRVKLNINGDANDGIKNYINASYVTDYAGEVKYIACQGPKLGVTVAHFWQMVWQEKIRVIVMLTDCCEKGKEKCAEYWPATKRCLEKHGDVAVILHNVEEKQINIKKRDFVIGMGDESRPVVQFQYVGWPDHGVPVLCSPILKLRAAVKAATRNNDVTLVHCSAGVGRTGTYIMIDDVLNQNAATEKFSVKDTIHKLRHHRDKMVQTNGQYMFVHHAILEQLTIGCTDVLQSEFVDRMEADGAREKEFETLNIIRLGDTSEECQGRSVVHKNKNRSIAIVPDDYCRPSLQTPMEGRGTYINACYVNNMSKSPRLIATQLPLEDSVIDLWRLVYDKGIQLIVRIDDIASDDNSSVQYWPRSGLSQIGPFSFEFVRSDVTDSHYTVDILAMRNTKNGSLPASTVRIIVFHGWPENRLVPVSPSSMVTLYKAVKQYQSIGKEPVLVQCFDGATKSGLFCATYCLLESLNDEDSVSVYDATRTIQSTRPQFIPNMDQFSFLHAVVRDYLTSLLLYKDDENIYENQANAREEEEDVYVNIPRRSLTATTSSGYTRI